MNEQENAPPSGAQTAESQRQAGRDRKPKVTPLAAAGTSMEVDGKSTGGRWGAAAGDWDHFDLVLELTADLLPVVSDPNAVKSPDSKIGGPGKTPSRFKRNGEMVGFYEWTQHVSKSTEVTEWRNDSRLGICLQTRRVRAIDVDVENADEAREIEAFILSTVGFPLPTRRRSDSAKFAMLFTLPGDYTKRRFKAKTAGGVVELLCNGQQIVIAGTHPKGARYEFDGGRPVSIPALTAEALETLWAALNARFGSEDSVAVNKGVAPTIRRTAANIADDTVRFLVENWTVHGVDRSGRVDILCPWDSEHTSDSGESATSYFPAGVGGFDQGHFKCQHAHCLHRADSEFDAAIGIGAADFEVIAEPYDPPPLPAFTRAESGRDRGKIEPTRNNLAAALARPDICGHRLRFDTFLDDLMIAEGTDGGEWREFRDEDYYALAMHLEYGGNGFKHIPSDTLRDAVKFICKKQKFDTAQAWLDGLKWDGTPRVATFLPRFVGAPDNPYTRAVGFYWWTAQAGRVIRPGVKADMALIAVGEQGAKKTSLVHALVPSDRFAGELDLSDDRIEIARSMRGKLIMELGELSGFSKRSVEHTKAFISRQKEAWTPKYKEFTTEVLRRCMFFGTTNSDEILVDETGNRRWLPFRSSGADPVGLAAVRDQLWAEGAMLFKSNGIMWQEAERLAKEVHAEFTVTDPWDSAVYTWLFSDDPFTDEHGNSGRPADRKFTNSEVLSMAVHIEVGKQTKALETRMGKILNRFGFERIQERIPKTEKGDKSHRWIYRRKGADVTAVTAE